MSLKNKLNLKTTKNKITPFFFQRATAIFTVLCLSEQMSPSVVGILPECLPVGGSNATLTW